MLRSEAERLVYQYGTDILDAPRMQEQKRCMQHGCVSVYEHSFEVACMSLMLAERSRDAGRMDLRALVRGALLHDYFLYDWHIPDRTHRLHGFTHARRAYYNAKRDFDLGSIECDIIRKHMFPLTPIPPRYPESRIVCLADKICALRESIPLLAAFC